MQVQLHSKKTRTYLRPTCTNSSSMLSKRLVWKFRCRTGAFELSRSRRFSHSSMNTLAFSSRRKKHQKWARWQTVFANCLEIKTLKFSWVRLARLSNPSQTWRTSWMPTFRNFLLSYANVLPRWTQRSARPARQPCVKFMNTLTAAF